MNGFKRLIGQVLRLSVAFTGLAAFSVLLGRLHPDTATIQALRLERCADGKACFLGIVPGVTPVDTILQELRARHDALITSLGLSSAASTFVGGTPTERQIAVIVIRPAAGNRFPAVGDFIRLYGPPCNIVPIPGYRPGGNYRTPITNVRLIYPNLALSVAFTPSRLDPNTPVFELHISNPISGEKFACADGARLTWAGFAGSFHYTRRWGANS